MTAEPIANGEAMRAPAYSAASEDQGGERGAEKEKGSLVVVLLVILVLSAASQMDSGIIPPALSLVEQESDPGLFQ